MLTNVYIPLVVAAVAGAVAIFGYLINSRIGRLQEREQYFVQALLAVERYKQLPYWRHRLLDRAEFAKKIAEVHENLAHHRRLLQLDSPEVYKAYIALINTIRSRNKVADRPEMDINEQVDGTKIELDKEYSSKSKPDRDECLRLMRSRLRLFPFCSRSYRRPPESISPTSEESLRDLSE
jgi:hypothetical protein